MVINQPNRDIPIVAAAAPVSSAHAIENREVIQAVRAVNTAALLGQDQEIVFRLDQRTRRVVTRVVNRDTGEVLAQVPAEYVLRLAEDLKPKG
jgi:flagellar protein FlaG